MSFAQFMLQLHDLLTTNNYHYFKFFSALTIVLMGLTYLMTRAPVKLLPLAGLYTFLTLAVILPISQ